MKNKLLFIFVIILVVISCELFESENIDSTPPEINVTIQGGNEISRETTLYLDIIDDSDIDSVSILIGDSVFTTVYSNFDTIKFSVNEIENNGISERPIELLFDQKETLTVKAFDSEGNVGVSETVDVIITVFPGWRIYDINTGFWAFNIDDNDLIWMRIGNGSDGLAVFNPKDNLIRILNSQNSDLPSNFIQDIAIVDGSRVWIATYHYICEYHYDLDKWIKIIEVPNLLNSGDSHYSDDRHFIGSIVVDTNFNLFIATISGEAHLLYNGANFTPYPISRVYEGWDCALHPNGDIYIVGDSGIDVFKNGIIQSFDDFPYSGLDRSQIVIDKSGNVWIANNRGLLKYDGTGWEPVYYNGYTTPFFADQKGTLYCFNQFNNNKNIVTYDGNQWLSWKEFDTPLNNLERPIII